MQMNLFALKALMTKSRARIYMIAELLHRAWWCLKRRALSLKAKQWRTNTWHLGAPLSRESLHSPVIISPIITRISVNFPAHPPYSFLTSQRISFAMICISTKSKVILTIKVIYLWRFKQCTKVSFLTVIFYPCTYIVSG